MNMLTCTDKTNGFKTKILLQKSEVKQATNTVKLALLASSCYRTMSKYASFQYFEILNMRKLHLI